MMTKDSARPVRPRSRTLTVRELLRPHWISLGLAFLAVLGETAADVLEPWPIKIVIDSVVQSKPLPKWLLAFAANAFSQDKYTTLYVAVTAVVLIAVVG